MCVARVPRSPSNLDFLPYRVTLYTGFSMGAAFSSAQASATRAGAGSSQALVLAFASSGASLRQREASWAGLLPPEMHALILKHLPVTPEYGNITGVVGTVGNGVYRDRAGDNSSMCQVSFGSNSTVWAVDDDGHCVHHFKQSGELIKTFGTGLVLPCRCLRVTPQGQRLRQ